MLSGMTAVCDFFGASSDAAAAELVDVGPSGVPRPAPPADRPQFPESWTVIWIEDRPKLRTSAQGVLVVSTTDIDPGVQIGMLEELLTGVHFLLVCDLPRFAKVLAETDEMLVLTLTDSLQTALAAATPEQLIAVATPWALHDEIYAHGDPRSARTSCSSWPTSRGAQSSGASIYTPGPLLMPCSDTQGADPGANP
jgi:hypothetical protein